MMKIFLLATITLLVLCSASYGQQANCLNWTDTQWYIGSAWNSTKITPCHADAYYNCHGFVLSYFENGCQPSGPQAPPYLCPEAQGDLTGGAITNNGKVLQVCDETQGNIVFYEIGSGRGNIPLSKLTLEAPQSIFRNTEPMDHW